MRRERRPMATTTMIMFFHMERLNNWTCCFTQFWR
jgi:hypothetical protein